jgi:hypothetical protein
VIEVDGRFVLASGRVLSGHAAAGLRGLLPGERYNHEPLIKPDALATPAERAEIAVFMCHRWREWVEGGIDAGRAAGSTEAANARIGRLTP